MRFRSLLSKLRKHHQRTAPPPSVLDRHLRICPTRLAAGRARAARGGGLTCPVRSITPSDVDVRLIAADVFQAAKLN
ncbi:hypothetical protein EVAR_69864_1 [Eumeta japonica]|uniref:Uncharacterized protein n=1 Tax=Eumeta variegata TaxID=151549 RepID=A0A4C2AGG1_EUMVA|nr:hypothetical protein EVAR_69864_1 [Eumeta japonica]